MLALEVVSTVSHSLSWEIMLTFEYVVVGIPPSMTESTPLAALLG